MSGILQIMAASKRVSPIASTSITLTSGSASQPGGPQVDRIQYGYSADVGIGSRSPTSISGYTVNDLRERLDFASNDGAYTSLTARAVHFKLTGGAAPLIASDITSIGCPGGQTLTGLTATFTPAADGGEWVWTGTTGTNDGTADYMSSGTLTVTI